jgi:K+-transporting ATPase ATPase C chain
MRALRPALVAVIMLTAVLGLAYPLAMTGAAQVLFPGRANGSMVMAEGRTAGSRLIGQDFSAHPEYFQSRPSVTGYAPAATAFNNQGPNQAELATQLKANVRSYLRREWPYTPGLTAARIPSDAVTSSASGVDPDISEANARIQANRVAKQRHLPLGRVLALMDEHTSRPLLGLAGEKSVNVLALNLALGRKDVR